MRAPACMWDNLSSGIGARALKREACGGASGKGRKRKVTLHGKKDRVKSWELKGEK